MHIETSFADFVAVGLNATDTIIRLPGFPQFDSKMELVSSEIQLGGQAATAAIACRRWGWRSRYVGKIGDDDAGRLHKAAFAAEGVEAHLIEVPECRSQYSFILVDQTSGERTILWKHDPRLDLQAEDLRANWITRAKILLVDGHPCAPSIAAAKWAREAGITTVADLDNLYPEIEVLLEYIDYAITSREFPSRVTGIPYPCDALVEISRRFRCRVAGATLGRDGAIAWDGVASHFHHAPGYEVDAVDTTGAGDVIHAGIVHALLRGENLDYALDFACAAAALNCTAYGARGGIQPLDEIEAFMRSGKRRVPLFSPELLRKYALSKDEL